MNTQLIAIIFQECGKLLSQIIISRPHKAIESPRTTEEFPEVTKEYQSSEGKATSVEAGCVPCAIGHLGTCSGLINEAMRFAKKDGVESSEVIDRVNMCLDELNVMERVDLRPELIADLPVWEKKLANKALTESRNTRHELEGLTSKDNLEKIAAKMQSVRQGIGREWFKQRLTNTPKEEDPNLAEKSIEKSESMT